MADRGTQHTKVSSELIRIDTAFALDLPNKDLSLKNIWKIDWKMLFFNKKNVLNEWNLN